MGNYNTDNLIFNPNPPDGASRQNGWKTVNGWNYEAKKLSYCLIANKGKRYTWHVTINIHHVLTDKAHKSLWGKASRVFRQHFTAFFIREPDRDNHVNYHLVINSDVCKERLKVCLESAFSQVNNTITIAEIKTTVGLANYITKHGRYANQRMYFSKESTLNKHGTIGGFWCKSPKKLWDDCVLTERRISRTLNEGYSDIQPAAKYLYWLIDGYIPFRHIRRNLTLGYPENKDTLASLAERFRVEYPIIAPHERNDR